MEWGNSMGGSPYVVCHGVLEACPDAVDLVEGQGGVENEWWRGGNPSHSDLLVRHAQGVADAHHAVLGQLVHLAEEQGQRTRLGAWGCKGRSRYVYNRQGAHKAGAINSPGVGAGGAAAAAADSEESPAAASAVAPGTACVIGRRGEENIWMARADPPLTDGLAVTALLGLALRGDGRQW